MRRGGLHRVPLRGEGVEEGGGGPIGGLAVIAQERGEGAEHEEEIKVEEDVMDVPGALDFGRDYCGVLFIRRFFQENILGETFSELYPCGRWKCY